MSAWVSSTCAQVRPRASKASSYSRISRLWPAAAAACLSAISRGREGSRRRSTPRTTAPLDTRTGKRAPPPATAATSSQSAENRSRSSVGAPACPPLPANTAEPILITGRRVWASWVRGLCVIASASAHPYDSKAPGSVQTRGLLRAQADRLDTVAAGVEDESRVVRLAVARPGARFSVVFTASRERRRVEPLDGCAIVGLEGQVERAPGPAGPEPWLRCPPGGRLPRRAHPSRMPADDGGRAADEMRSGHLHDGGALQGEAGDAPFEEWHGDASVAFVTQGGFGYRCSAGSAALGPGAVLHARRSRRRTMPLVRLLRRSGGGGRRLGGQHRAVPARGPSRRAGARGAGPFRLPR